MHSVGAYKCYSRPKRITSYDAICVTQKWNYELNSSLHFENIDPVEIEHNKKNGLKNYHTVENILLTSKKTMIMENSNRKINLDTKVFHRTVLISN